MKTKNKKICVIGAGQWGKNHIRTLNSMNCLGGIVEEDLNALNSIKKAYPQSKFFDNVEKAILSDFDGFVVSTPAHTHYKIANRIITKGFPVLIEKPITLNSSEAIYLHELSKKHNVN